MKKEYKNKKELKQKQENTLLFQIEKNIQLIKMPSQGQQGKIKYQKKLIDSQFSFVQKPIKQYRSKAPSHKSIPKTDVSNNSSDTFDFSLPSVNNKERDIFTQSLPTVSDKGLNIVELNITEEIRYKNPQQYQKKVQHLLMKTNMGDKSKIYLRLILVDRQSKKDKRLNEYLQRAFEHYRQFKLSLLDQ